MLGFIRPVQRIVPSACVLWREPITFGGGSLNFNRTWSGRGPIFCKGSKFFMTSDQPFNSMCSTKRHASGNVRYVSLIQLWKKRNSIPHPFNCPLYASNLMERGSPLSRLITGGEYLIIAYSETTRTSCGTLNLYKLFI